MSKKTRKKSSKASPGKSGRTSAAKPSAAKTARGAKASAKKPAAKKPARRSQDRPARPAKGAGKKPAQASKTASAKASHKAPSKSLKSNPSAAAKAESPARSQARLVTPVPETGGLVEGAQGPRLPVAARRRRQRLARRLRRQETRAVFLSARRHARLHPGGDRLHAAERARSPTSGTAVLGVSADTVKAQESFRDKHQLSVPLISDETHEMLEAYGAWGEKSMYGRSFMGIIRTTVLIGADGRIAKIWRNVRVDGHADEVLAAVRRPCSLRFHFPKINHERVKSAPQIQPYGTHLRPARECRCRTVPVIIPSTTIPP